LTALFILALVLCAVSGIVGNILHFRMKFRLNDAGLPVKWFMMPSDDFRMWRTYLLEAPRRQWPVWPFYVYRVVMTLFIASGLVVALKIAFGR
jgi:hypothetical protein